MKQILTLLFILLSVSFTFAQNAPIDFETNGYGANWTWTVFENDTNPPVEIIANPDMSGANTSATVAKFTALQTGQPWAGCESLHGSDIGSFSFDVNNSTVKIMVWKSVISDCGIKFAEASGDAQPEVKVANTLINQWEELSFDLSGSIGAGTTGIIDQIIFFPDFDLDGRTQDYVIYFDNITFSEQTSGAGNVDLPITFDDAELDYELQDFGGTASEIVVDPTDAENMVVQTVKNADQTWAGTTVANINGFANPIPFATGATKMSVAVWSPNAGIPVLFKVEDHTNGGVSVETEMMTTVAGDWEVLTFDFLNNVAGTPALDLAMTYDKASIFFNFGTVGSGLTYYWDDVEFIEGVVPTLVDLPITFDDAELDYELQDFGGTASEIVVDPTDAENMVVQTVKNADQTWAGTTVANINGFANPIPFATGATKMSVAVWSPNAGIPVLFKVEDHTNGGVSVETEMMTTVAGDWEVLTFDFLNNVAGTPALDLAMTYDKASIFFNFGSVGSGLTYYWDDVEFHVDPIGVIEQNITKVRVYPNPATNVLNIENFNIYKSLSIYSVTGSLIYQTKEVNNSIDISYLSSGIYSINAIDSNGLNYKTKFIVK